MEIWLAGMLGMEPVLARILAGWPLAASMAVAVGAQGLWAGRRRTALNEAVHELRRPLQALSLAVPGGHRAGPGGIEWSVQMAAVALERLDREINGDAVATVSAPVCVRPLVESAVGRWRVGAALAGSSLDLDWGAGETVVDGDRCGIAQALENLILNAIEHGGPTIVVAARLGEGKLCVSVTDCGATRPESPPGPAGLVARLSGRRRHGHGLRVVRRIAAAHRGDFRLRRSERGTEAVIELPVLSAGREAVA